MEPTTFVKPYPGLILAEIPRSGAHIPTGQADDWIAHGLVVPAKEPPMSEQTQADRQAELASQQAVIDAVATAAAEELPGIGADNGVPKDEPAAAVAGPETDGPPKAARGRRASADA